MIPRNSGSSLPTNIPHLGDRCLAGQIYSRSCVSYSYCSSSTSPGGTRTAHSARSSSTWFVGWICALQILDGLWQRQLGEELDHLCTVDRYTMFCSRFATFATPKNKSRHYLQILNTW